MTQPLFRSLGWTWWTKRPTYLLVFLRETSSVFIAIQVVLVLVLLHKAGQSAADYQAYQDFLWNPGMVVFHVISIAFAMLHTVTWFNLLPSTIAIRIMGRRIPALLLVAPQFGAWAVVTGLVIAWVWWVGAG